MTQDKRFFELNLQFAAKAAELSGSLLEDTLMDHTCLYRRFKLGIDFDPCNPIWQFYLAGLRQAEDQSEWTYNFYLKHQRQRQTTHSENPFGCFAYAQWSDTEIRLHFHNDELGHHRPLSEARHSVRMAELHRMFAHIHQHEKQATTVIGGSWLYNIEAYTRLFPPVYIESAQIGGDDYQFLAIWGQFLNYQARVKPELATHFLTRLDKCRSTDGLIRCFPFRILYLSCPIEKFYHFYQIQQ